MKKRALITGITGQDGSYLSELLLSKDYQVFGVIRRSSSEELQLSRINHIINNIELIYGDLTDYNSIYAAIKSSRPHEIYNLGAQSHVKISFDNPIATIQSTGLGALNVFESVRDLYLKSKIYQAGSSEMFGNNCDIDGFQRETTPFKPASPYACAKVFAHNIAVNYRNSYKMFIANGILFNHESPRRGLNFVTSKVCKGVADIYDGTKEYITLGNLDSYRDWGHAKDYVRGMYLMLQQDTPDDFVLATADTHSIKDLCSIAFASVGIDNYNNFIRQDAKFMRPEEVIKLRGDYTKARNVLGWMPIYTFTDLIEEMVNSYKENNK